MSVSLKKELGQILREARRQGWRVELQRSGHYKLYPPHGRRSHAILWIQMEGALMEFWVRLTVAEHGRDEESGERLLTALEDLGSVDPIADQNLVDGRLSASLSVEGRDAQDAVDRAVPLLLGGLERAGLAMTRLVGIEVNATDFEHAAPAA
jgi:hypothetical protein